MSSQWMVQLVRLEHLQTQQVLAADTGVGPAKMGTLRDAKNWEQHLGEFGFERLRLYDHCMICELGM